VVAAYLLVGTPLATVALIVAIANGFVALGGLLFQIRKGDEPPRAVTFIGHVTMALGGFFLFVWFSLPSGG
jgi:hypothetical protein